MGLIEEAPFVTPHKTAEQIKRTKCDYIFVNLLQTGRRFRIAVAGSGIVDRPGLRGAYNCIRRRLQIDNRDCQLLNFTT
jgi:hypothetical protein